MANIEIGNTLRKISATHVIKVSFALNSYPPGQTCYPVKFVYSPGNTSKLPNTDYCQLAIPYQLTCSPIACSYPSTPSHCSHTKQYFQILQVKSSTNYTLWFCPTASSHIPPPLPTGLISNTSWENSQYWGPIKLCCFIWQVKFPNLHRLLLQQ